VAHSTDFGGCAFGTLVLVRVDFDILAALNGPNFRRSKAKMLISKAGPVIPFIAEASAVADRTTSYIGFVDPAISQSCKKEEQMSEENKVVVRRFVEEVWSKGNLSVADQLIFANYSHHDNATPDFGSGPQGEKKRAEFTAPRFTTCGLPSRT
jgi:hypothetical protein